MLLLIDFSPGWGNIFLLLHKFILFLLDAGNYKFHIFYCFSLFLLYVRFVLRFFIGSVAFLFSSFFKCHFEAWFLRSFLRERGWVLRTFYPRVSLGRLIRYGASGIDTKRLLHLSWPLYSVWWEFELFPVICVFGKYFRLQDPVIFFLFLKFIFAKICGFLPYLCLCWFSAKDLWCPMA